MLNVFSKKRTARLVGLSVSVICGIAAHGIGHSEEAPKQTNRERGMLNLNEAFGPQPKVKLCEIVEDGKPALRDCVKVEADKRKM